MSEKRIITVVLLVAFCMLSFAKTIELKWVGDQPGMPVGVSWGVPFEKGMYKPHQVFEMTDNQSSVPLQSWPLAYWPDGSVKWMGFAAVVQPKEKYFLSSAKSKKTFQGLKIESADNVIRVESGDLQIQLGKSGEYLIHHLSLRGKKVGENARLSATVEQRMHNNAKTFDYTSEITDAVIEQTGPVRGVVKFSGRHVSKNAPSSILPFTVRLYFYAGMPTIKMVHSFVYDVNHEQDFIKSIGLSFDVPMRESMHNRHVRFAGEDGGLWSEPVKPMISRYPFVYKGEGGLPENQMAGLRVPEIQATDSLAYAYYNYFPTWNDYQLTQIHSDAFTISKRTNDKSSWLFAGSGARSAGMVLAGDVSGGIAVGLKDFWQTYPSSLEVKDMTSDKARVNVWLWAKEAEAMDTRHYDTIGHDLNATYEDFQEGMSTPFGIAQTHEITLFAFDQLPDKQQTSLMAQTVQGINQLVCTPQYLHSVKAFGRWSLPDRSNPTRRWIEEQLDASIDFYKRAVEEHRWYGFWNYGDVMHTYDPIRHVWRYDIGGYAWANTELAPGNWLWYTFLRSGDAEVYKMAAAMTRHTGEVDAYHIGDMKGLGTRHNVSHWGCGAKEARVGQAAWKRHYYYLTTDERTGDLMRESLDAEKAVCLLDPLRIAQPRERFPYNAPARLRWGPDWLALAGNWLTEWERTGDAKYRDKIVAGLTSLTKLPSGLFSGPNGLGYDPATGILTYDGNPDVVNRNHLATIMGGYEILEELFQMIDHPSFMKTYTEYCKFYGMPDDDPERNDKNRRWGNNNFRIPRLGAFAAHQLNDDRIAQRAWDDFLADRQGIPMVGKPLYDARLIDVPHVLRTVHENPRVGTNGAAQWGLNAIFMLELIGDQLPDSTTRVNARDFEKAYADKWDLTFVDDFKKPWTHQWFLDGEKAKLSHSRKGLDFYAGATPASDADHTVLWTKREFEGDIRVEFDFVRLDSATKFVNIIYLHAKGSGKNEYSEDITKWSHLRRIPAMRTYFEHMDLYHVSFAAFENDNNNPQADYIRARRYLPERGEGLRGTDLLPEFLNTGLFEPGVLHQFVIIKKGDDLFMKINANQKERIYRWDTKQFPDLTAGRIGLRLMGARASRFSNFRVFTSSK